MEEIRIDLSVPDPARRQEGHASEELCYQINQLSPYDPDIFRLEKDLFEAIGESSMVKPPLFVNLGRHVCIGERVAIMPGFNCMAAGGLEIEDDAMIGLNCCIATNNHDPYQRNVLTCKPVKIKKGAWIGMNVTILPGVTIGKYAIVGAGSVVTKSVDDYAVAAGNPARIIRRLDSEGFAD